MKHKARVGLVTEVGNVVVPVEVNSHKLPAKPVGHIHVDKIVQVPPFWQPAEKHDTNALILYSHKLPPNPDAQLH